jgi:hypothetical protein
VIHKGHTPSRVIRILLAPRGEIKSQKQPEG